MDTSSFTKFVADNGILAASAGITIGFATATFVKSFVADVIMPIIFLIIVSMNKKASSFLGKFLSSTDLRFANFVSELITWVFIILTAFLVIEVIRRSMHSNQQGSTSTYANPMLPQSKEHYAPLVNNYYATEEEEPVSASIYGNDSMAYFQ